jgi:hypothetical protein
MKQNLLILLTFWGASLGSINKNMIVFEADRGVLLKEVIDNKICRMELELDYRVDDRVLSRIKRYVTYGKKGYRIIIGKITLLFSNF